MAAANVEISSEHSADKKLTYKKMISTAIAQLAERKGSSRQAIKKYLRNNFSVPDSSDHLINDAIKKGVASEEFTQPKGPSGPVKLSAKGREVLLGKKKQLKKEKLQPRAQPKDSATIAKVKTTTTPEVSIPKHSSEDDNGKESETKEEQGTKPQSKDIKMDKELKKDSEGDATGKKRGKVKGQRKPQKFHAGSMSDKDLSEAKQEQVSNKENNSKTKKVRQTRPRPQKGVSASKAEESTKSKQESTNKSDSEATDSREELSRGSGEDNIEEKEIRQTRSKIRKDISASKTEEPVKPKRGQSDELGSGDNEASDMPKKRRSKHPVKPPKEGKLMDPKSTDVKSKFDGKGSNDEIQEDSETEAHVESNGNAGESGEKQQNDRGNGNNVAKEKKRSNRRRA